MNQIKLDHDKNLMVAFQGGNENEYTELYQKYLPIFSFCKGFSTNFTKEVAEDITQETLIKLYNKKDYYDPNYNAKFNTWLYKIVENLAKVGLRKVKRKKDRVMVIF